MMIDDEVDGGAGGQRVVAGLRLRIHERQGREPAHVELVERHDWNRARTHQRPVLGAADDAAVTDRGRASECGLEQRLETVCRRQRIGIGIVVGDDQRLAGHVQIVEQTIDERDGFENFLPAKWHRRRMRQTPLPPQGA
jgi:hypothetical protein